MSMIPEISFNPVHCAELHNRLLAKAIENIPGAERRVHRDLIPRIEEEATSTWPNGIQLPSDGPVYHFFSLLDSYRPDDLPLTAEFRQPIPSWFDGPYHQFDDRDFILLYPDNLYECPYDGGLYFNLDTYLVTWGRLEHGPLPPDVDWVPLELALKKALDMWECGKFSWNGNTVSLQTWVPQDVTESLSAWNRLLTAISARLPVPSGTEKPSVLDPLSSEMVNETEISPFARAFLTAARRPSFTYVAPGITTFTPQTFRDIYGNERSDAPRRAFVRDLNEEISSLLLPAAADPVPKPGKSSTDTSLNGDFPNADFTVSRHAGLYTLPTTWMMDADSVWLTTANGVVDSVRFDGQRPWGPPRSVKTAELLDLWSDMVEAGIWDVGPDGVTTPHGWFTQVDTEVYRTLT